MLIGRIKLNIFVVLWHKARLIVLFCVLMPILGLACGQSFSSPKSNGSVQVSAVRLPVEEAEAPFDYSLWFQENREAFLQSAVQGQMGMAAPSVELALYFLRADENSAAHTILASLYESGDDNSRFLYEKSRILECEKKGCETLEHAPSESLSAMLEASRLSEWREHYRFWLVRALLLEGDIERASAEIELFAKYGGEAVKFNALVLRAAPKWRSARQLYKQANRLLMKLQDQGNAFEAAIALKTRYDLALDAGEEKGARALKRQLLERYPATQMSLWPELGEDLSAQLSAAQRFARAQRLIRHFDYDNARIELRKLAEIAKYRDEARWMIARISMSNPENPTESEEIYRDFAKRPGARREDATYGIAQSLSRRLDYRGALKALDVYARAYPRGKHSKRVLYLRGWYLFDLRDNELARPYLLEYAKTYRDTAVWGFYAWTFVREERWREAIEAFNELLGNSNPIVRGKALYWQAYCWQKLGKTDEARRKYSALHEEFPLTYYDILAYYREAEFYGDNDVVALQERFRNAEDRLDTSDFAMTPFGYAKDMKDASKEKIWREILNWVWQDEISVARALYQKHEKRLLSSVEAKKRDDFRAYANALVEDYYNAWKDASGSVRAMSKIYPQRNSARHKMAYPRAFRPLVESLERRFEVPAVFIYAIMLQESRFRAWQVSSADAIGALQMIPKTARVLAKELGLEYHPDQFFDPKVGFVYSAYYMQKHLRMWQNNLTMTAGSYNGGPHRIGPWMLRDEGASMDFLIEEFSFDESRHYARKVAEHCLRYIYLYEQDPQKQAKILEMLFPRVVNYNIPRDDFGI
ncbi:MAG: transglycosylase SLT domain-containing protein [Bradymonadales bacterium]